MAKLRAKSLNACTSDPKYISCKQIHWLLKVAPLLAEFFYANKRLDLPGIGSFVLDPASVFDADQVKSGKNISVDGISFEADTTIKESPDLINFIAANTGKIKALAAADLDSHLELARQFLNIGKPFLFEGIGSITKLQTGNFSFSPGAIPAEKATSKALKEYTDVPDTEESSGGFRNIFYARKVKTGGRKILVVALLLSGIALAIWGGYTLYKKTTSKKESISAGKQEETQTDSPETTDPGNITTPDTANNLPAGISSNVPAATPAGTFRFVVETADKKRGLARFNKLKGYGVDIKMDTKDSVVFKLYFPLPAAAADTSRLIDSLRRLYTPAGHKAFVEN